VDNEPRLVSSTARAKATPSATPAVQNVLLIPDAILRQRKDDAQRGGRERGFDADPDACDDEPGAGSKAPASSRGERQLPVTSASPID
jgi:hypothetical protein